MSEFVLSDVYVDDPDFDIVATTFEKWEVFLRAEGLQTIFANDMSEHQVIYLSALNECGIKYNYKLFNSIKNESYILRFKTKQAKLAFLLKWS
jgi:hypothetical protein